MISSDIIPIYFLIIAGISKMKLEMFLDERSDTHRGAEGGPERECSVICSRDAEVYVRVRCVCFSTCVVETPLFRCRKLNTNELQ